jgi:hypothetical protein
MDIGSSGGSMSDWPYRYCLVWDFFKRGGNYQVWQELCEDLGEVFSQYENVRWGCSSFRFTINFTELNWIVVDKLLEKDKQIYDTANEYWYKGDSMDSLALALTKGEFIQMIRRDMV